MPSLLRPRQVRPTDPYLRWVVSDREPPALVHRGENVAWLGRAARPGEAWITGLGDEASTVVALVEELARAHDVDGVTVSEPAFALLPDHLRSPDPGHWCFWTLDPAGLEPVETSAVGLSLDDGRIAALLEHSDSAHIFPGDPAIVRWSGVLVDERLVAVAGQVTERSGAAHLVSVCTHPEFRGRGLAGQACRHALQAAVAEGAPMLVLEMYVANEAGRRTYRALGFTEVGRYFSGLLAHALPPRRP